MKQRFGVKSALAGASGLFAMGTGVTASAQDDSSETDAVVDDDSSIATSGDTTVSVIDGVATIDAPEEDEEEVEGDEEEVEDDASDEVVAEDEDSEGDEDEDGESEISVDGGLALVDASGGDGNFSFVS